MADSVVWAPIPGFEDVAFVPRVGYEGLRRWDKDGPVDPTTDVQPPPAPLQMRVYEWRGSKLLVCA